MDQKGQPYRKSIRLRDFDYAEPGTYFVSVCARNRVGIFGEVVGGAMRLNMYGEIVVDCWRALPKHFRHVQLDEFVVMPNHIHGILVTSDVGATHASPLRDTDPTLRPSGPLPGSLGAIVGSFKSAVTNRINRFRDAPGTVWQRNYYEHIIRSNVEMDRIREYVSNNPAEWEIDVENPAKRGRTPFPH